MVAIQDQPPFSIELRLADPALLDRIPGRKLEVRLPIDPAHRNQMVIAGLLGTTIGMAIDEGYEVLLISGIEGHASMTGGSGSHAWVRPYRAARRPTSPWRCGSRSCRKRSGKTLICGAAGR